VTWLAWRQFRAQVLVGLAVLAALAVFVFITGPHIAHFYNSTLVTCTKHNVCNGASNTFARLTRLIPLLNDLALLGPALVGIFWGAPLVAREIETGSLRLAFTQSVTRTRWIITKLAIVGLASVVIAAIMSLLITWWASPWDAFNDLPFGTFDNRDIVPVAYALFAFALGVLIGVLVRRTVAAMGLTLVVYIAATSAFGQWVRPHLLTALRTTTRYIIPVSNGPASIRPSQVKGLQGAWTIWSETIIKTGRVVGQRGGIYNINFRPAGNGRTYFVGVGMCPNKIPAAHRTGTNGPPSAAVQHAVQTCINSFHLRQVFEYQPASRYWTFQWMESGIFVALALGIAAFTIWWVRRRVA
jgi:hypothetical protein